MHQNTRIIKCPECGRDVKEITTFDESGCIIESHAFCEDDNESGCLWGGAWPDNSRNVDNCKKREKEGGQDGEK